MKGIHLIIQVLALQALLVFVAGKDNAKYSPAEQEALKKFRELVSDDLYKDYMRTDKYLIRWLRTKNLDLERAREMLLKSLKWRKANNIDRILEEDVSKFGKGYPVFSGGLDKLGRPVCVLPIGKWDLRKAAVTGLAPQVQRYFYYIVEKEVKIIQDLADDTGKNVTQFLLIVDLAGFTVRQQGCFPCLASFVGLIVNLEQNYPLMTKHAILINSPRILTSVLAPFKPLLSQVSHDTLIIYGLERSHWEKALLDLIPADQLPKQYGGSKVYNQQ